jgi:hypothetical protein
MAVVYSHLLATGLHATVSFNEPFLHIISTKVHLIYERRYVTPSVGSLNLEEEESCVVMSESPTVI